MDKTRHRPILRALRPHGADRLDPDAQPALGAMEADSHLRAWFEREQAFDRAFAARAQSAPVPAHLRASIFAAVETAARARPRPQRRILIHRPLATFVAALAAAASLALVAILLWPNRVRPADLEDVIAAAAAIAPDQAPAPELAGRTLDEIRDWLAGRSAPVPGALPSALARLPTDGTAVVELRGITASVVVFAADGLSREPSSSATGRRLVLFTLPRQSCSTEGITREPTVREVGGHALAVWRDATAIYVLAVDGPAAKLRRFLGSVTQVGGITAPTHRASDTGSAHGHARAT